MRQTFDVETLNSNDGSQTIRVWLSAAERTVDDIDVEIKEFLGKLMACGFDKESENVLRIGIFYNLDETIVFPFSISASTASLLGECGMSC